jgi:transcriptional regulator with XRE-family HTH domain
MSASLVVAATVDVRRVSGWRRQLGLSQQDLAKRIGARSDDVSRLERYLAPGELLDRVVDGLTAAPADEAPQNG